MPLRALLAVAVLLAALAGGCNGDAADAKQRFAPGLVSTDDHRLSAIAAGKLGARVVRVEFDIGTPAASLRPTVAALTRRGARPLLLAGFHGRMPTEAEARNVGSWAAEFGPGGSYWAKHRRHRLPVRLIEFGNETSYTRPVRGQLLGPVLQGSSRAVRDALRPGAPRDRAAGGWGCWPRRTTAAAPRRSG